MELKRHNYVTPTNYLELVKGYNTLLEEKRSELGDSANKLGNGLAKLEESRLQVEKMSVELEKKKVRFPQKYGIQACDLPAESDSCLGFPTTGGCRTSPKGL